MFKYGQVLMCVVLFTLQSGFNFSTAKADAVTLFTEAGNARPTIEKPNASSVIRFRYVHLNKPAIESLLKAMSIDESGNPPNVHKIPLISFNLFPDANFIGEVTMIDAGVLAGNLQDNSGFFQLVVSGDSFMAHISSSRAPQGEFEVSAAGDALYKVIEIDQSKLKPD